MNGTRPDLINGRRDPGRRKMKKFYGLIWALCLGAAAAAHGQPVAATGGAH